MARPWRRRADIWLGGRRRQQERHLPLAELVRVRVPGLRLQRSVERQFGQITDAVFDRLEPSLEHEFRGLDESGRQAVIDAVCDTFAWADLSDEAVLAADANAAEPIRRITGSVPTPVGLNEAESRLYEMLFAECVECYVRIVRSLPVFEERAAAELLARTATLGAEVARLLERLPDRSLLAPDGTDQDTASRRRYLELVSRDLDEVELFRRTSDRAAGPRVRLSAAYVSLRATGDDGSRRRTVRPPCLGCGRDERLRGGRGRELRDAGGGRAQRSWTRVCSAFRYNSMRSRGSCRPRFRCMAHIIAASRGVPASDWRWGRSFRLVSRARTAGGRPRDRAGRRRAPVPPGAAAVRRPPGPAGSYGPGASP